MNDLAITLDVDWAPDFVIDDCAVLGKAFSRLFIAHQQADLFKNLQRRLVYVANIIVAKVREEVHRAGLSKQWGLHQL